MLSSTIRIMQALRFHGYLSTIVFWNILSYTKLLIIYSILTLCWQFISFIRCDLNPANGTYPIAAMGHRSHGATDVKVTSSQLFQKLQFKAVSGPTQGTNNSLGPFCWSKSDFNKVSHLSQPDCFDFDPVLHQWSE